MIVWLRILMVAQGLTMLFGFSQMARSAAASAVWEAQPSTLEFKYPPTPGVFNYGFEAEFKGPGDAVIDYEKDRVRSSPFFYLEPKYDLEMSGNREVRSIGGETKRAEVEKQMAEVKAALNSNKRNATDGLKSFHLHIYVDTSSASAADIQKLKGFTSRLGDYVMAWRLTHRRPYLTLNSFSLQRLLPEQIMAQGVVRALDVKGGQYTDIEIRGGMDDIEFIMGCADYVERFWLNVASMPDVSHLQSTLLNYVQGNRVDLMRSVERDIGRSMQNSEIAFYSFLMKFVRPHSLPLMGAALDPMLNEEEKSRIVLADASFLARISKYLLTHQSGFPVNVDADPKIVDGFLQIFRDWAIDARILEAHSRILGDLSQYLTSDLNKNALLLDRKKNMTLQQAGALASGNERSKFLRWLGVMGRCASVFAPIVVK